MRYSIRILGMVQLFSLHLKDTHYNFLCQCPRDYLIHLFLCGISKTLRSPTISNSSINSEYLEIDSTRTSLILPPQKKYHLLYTQKTYASRNRIREQPAGASIPLPLLGATHSPIRLEMQIQFSRTLSTSLAPGMNNTY